MGFFRKVAFGALCVALSACTLSGCGDGLESSSLPKPEPKGTIVPTVYNVEEIVDADETEAGSIDAWTKEVFTSMGGNTARFGRYKRGKTCKLYLRV